MAHLISRNIRRLEDLDEFEIEPSDDPYDKDLPPYPAWKNAYDDLPSPKVLRWRMRDWRLIDLACYEIYEKNGSFEDRNLLQEPFSSYGMTYWTYIPRDAAELPPLDDMRKQIYRVEKMLRYPYSTNVITEPQSRDVAEALSKLHEAKHGLEFLQSSSPQGRLPMRNGCTHHGYTSWLLDDVEWLARKILYDSCYIIAMSAVDPSGVSHPHKFVKENFSKELEERIQGARAGYEALDGLWCQPEGSWWATQISQAEEKLRILHHFEANPQLRVAPTESYSKELKDLVDFVLEPAITEGARKYPKSKRDRILAKFGWRLSGLCQEREHPEKVLSWPLA